MRWKFCTGRPFAHQKYVILIDSGLIAAPNPTDMKTLRVISYWLVIIGGLNWGFVALGSYMSSNWNVVNLLLGSWPSVESLVYLLVGLATLVLIFIKGESRENKPVGM